MSTEYKDYTFALGFVKFQHNRADNRAVTPSPRGFHGFIEIIMKSNWISAEIRTGSYHKSDSPGIDRSVFFQDSNENILLQGRPLRGFSEHCDTWY